ncbi:hypothetical protein FHS37_006740 [Streptomyces griseostramineus]|uniref:Uncharacterized protein n=1 Tax=Streptomyces griseomycini TaxID=66895 RepID=A0A7W7PWQ3_9ACTN|nr:hypothetical protein [Streptomyces griseomycini]
MHLLGEFGVDLLCPVLGELVPVGVVEVVGGGVGEEDLRQVQADTETTGVHRRLKECLGGRAGGAVALQERGASGEVLRKTSVGTDAGEGVGQQPVTALGQRSRRGQGAGVEGVGDAHSASGEQLPHPTVRIRPTGSGQGGVLLDVVRPERAQHEDRPALRADQQVVHGRSDLLTGRPVTQVVLGLIQPYDRARADPVHVLKSGPGAGGVEGVPQPPPLLRQRLHGLPARPRLARRRAAHQDQHPAAADRSLPHRLRQDPVVLAGHVAGHQPLPGRA